MIELNFPEVEEPIATSTRQAVDYVINRFDNVLGIIAAGSILRGEGDAHSDVDTFVIIQDNYRQRVQKFFNGVRFELFVNAVEFVPRYFEEEKRDGGASTANMLVTGHVVLNRAPIVDDLIQQAQATLNAGPTYSEQALINHRYLLADRLENGLDLRQRDPVMGQILVDSALSGMMIYQFQKQGKWIPRHKDLLKVLWVEEPKLSQLLHDYYSTVGDQRFNIVGLIADYTLGVRGFFEWESDKDYLK